MSAVPPPYNPSTSFFTKAQQPIVVAGLPGSELDAEFGSVADTINAVRARLSQIQQDDGSIAYQSVGFAQLAPEIVQFAVSPSVRLRGFWQPNTPYVFDGTKADVFVYQGMTRIVAMTYMSGASFGIADETFTGALGNPPNIGTIIRDTFTGDGSTTAFTMTADPVTTTNVHVYVNGLMKLAGLDFTISGKVVTFTSAPANAAVIVTETGVVTELELTTVGDGAISTAKLAAGAVTSAKLAAGAVGTSILADSSVTGAKIVDNTITSAKLTDGSVTGPKIVAGAVSTSQLAANAVTSDNIQNGSVGTNKLATSAVATDTIANGAVTTAKLADNNISTAKLQDASVTTPKIADGNVTTAKVADGNITAVKLSGAQAGAAPIYGARAWASIDCLTNANKTGTYSQTTTVVTVSVTGHGLRVGHSIQATITSGSAVSGRFVVASVIDANNFTFTAASPATNSGNITLAFVTVLANGNISSVAKFGTGDYGINFTASLPSANYALTSSTIGTSNTVGLGSVAVTGNSAGSFAGPVELKTVDTVHVMTTANVSFSTTNFDMKYIGVVAFG